MKKLLFIVICCLIFCLANSGVIKALEEKSVQAQGISTFKLLEKAEHSTWQEKDKLLIELQSGEGELSEVEKSKLIKIFDQESKFEEDYVNNLRKQGMSINAAFDRFYEEYRRKGYATYFVNFANLVSSFEDERTIPSLLRALRHYGGAIVPTHIISIGEGAVEPLLALLKSKDRTLKNGALFVLSVWVNAPKEAADYSITADLVIKDSRLLGNIRASFLKCLQDEDSEVRSRAVYGLGAFADEVVVRELEEIAKNDPYLTKYSKKYLVRDEAKRSIEIIKTKIKNKRD